MSSRTTTPDLSVIQWFGRFSLGTSWSSLVTWSNDAGDEGDIFP